MSCEMNDELFDAIKDSVNKYKDKYQIDKYNSIINSVNEKKELDSNTIAEYKNFYKVNERMASPDWCEKYFNYLNECIKNNKQPKFEDVLTKLNTDDKCHMSFASKLIATLDQTKPIIDKYVLIALVLGQMPDVGLDIRMKYAWRYISVFFGFITVVNMKTLEIDAYRYLKKK